MSNQHTVSQFSIGERSDGSLQVSDLMGDPLDLGTAQYLIRVLTQYIATNTNEAILTQRKEHFARHHPGMYEQIFGEPLPAQYARRPGPLPVKPPKTPKVTYVYLMKDGHTGYCKIGRSNTPKMREGTLQSQKPSIELICYKKGTAQDENELHLRYQDKRWRGEWFDLSDDDIATLIAEFKAQGGVILADASGTGKGTK